MCFSNLTTPRAAGDLEIHVDTGPPEGEPLPFRIHCYRAGLLMTSFWVIDWESTKITITGPLGGRPDIDLELGDILTTYPVTYACPQQGDLLNEWGVPIRQTIQGLTPTPRTGENTAADGEVVLCDASAGGFTQMLPTATFARPGAVVTVAKIDSTSNQVLVHANGSDVINLPSGTATSLGITTPTQSYTFLYDGAGTWYIIASAVTP